MKPWLLAFTLVSLLSTTAFAQGKVSIQSSPLPVGTVITEHQKSSINLNIQITAQGQDQKKEVKENGQRIKSVTVKGNNKLTYNKVEVTYKDATQAKTGAQGTMPVAGKTYLVDISSGKLKISDKKGQEPPVQELEILRKDFRNLGKANPFITGLPKEPLKIGQRIDINKELLSYMFDGDTQNTNGMDLSKSFLKLKKVKKVKGKEVATFELVLYLKGQQGPMNMLMDLKGEINLFTSGGHPTTITLAGPINMDAGEKGGPMVLRGKGTMKVSNIYTYKTP